MSVTFQNKGLLEMRGIKTFGISAKDGANPIGFFGTGLKYAVAVLLREGCAIDMWVGNVHYTFTSRDVTFRDTDFPVVFMNDEELPFSTELGKHWKLWMAYRELYANCIDETDPSITIEDIGPLEDRTTIRVTSGAFEKIHEDRAEIFLQTKALHVLDGLELHDSVDAGNWIYHRGIRVHELPKKALYNYNITGDLGLTEDRTASSLSAIYLELSKAIVKSESPSLIRQILTADRRSFESTIDFNWWSTKPGEVYTKVVTSMYHGGVSFNSSAKDHYKAANEVEVLPDVVQLETIPMEQRRKLLAAHVFWKKLGLEIPRNLVHITADMGSTEGKVINRKIYLSKFVLDMEMRHITGLLYKLYSQTKPTIGSVVQTDLLLDTLVEFGERLLGVHK